MQQRTAHHHHRMQVVMQSQQCSMTHITPQNTLHREVRLRAAALEQACGQKGRSRLMKKGQ